MISKKSIQSISDKEMDRKEFLRYSGLALLGIFGLFNILNLLGGDIVKKTNLIKDSSNRGFGGGRYGT